MFLDSIKQKKHVGPIDTIEVAFRFDLINGCNEPNYAVGVYKRENANEVVIKHSKVSFADR